MTTNEVKQAEMDLDSAVRHVRVPISQKTIQSRIERQFEYLDKNCDTLKTLFRKNEQRYTQHQKWIIKTRSKRLRLEYRCFSYRGLSENEQNIVNAAKENLNYTTTGYETFEKLFPRNQTGSYKWNWEEPQNLVKNETLLGELKFLHSGHRVFERHISSYSSRYHTLVDLTTEIEDPFKTEDDQIKDFYESIMGDEAENDTSTFIDKAKQVAIMKKLLPKFAEKEKGDMDPDALVPESIKLSRTQKYLKRIVLMYLALAYFKELGEVQEVIMDRRRDFASLAVVAANTRRKEGDVQKVLSQARTRRPSSVEHFRETDAHMLRRGHVMVKESVDMEEKSEKLDPSAPRVNRLSTEEEEDKNVEESEVGEVPTAAVPPPVIAPRQKSRVKAFEKPEKRSLGDPPSWIDSSRKLYVEKAVQETLSGDAFEDVSRYKQPKARAIAARLAHAIVEKAPPPLTSLTMAMKTKSKLGNFKKRGTRVKPGVDILETVPDDEYSPAISKGTAKSDAAEQAVSFGKA